MENDGSTVMDECLKESVHTEHSLADIMKTINQLKEKYPDEVRKILGSDKKFKNEELE